MDIDRTILHEHEVNIAAEGKPAHCNTGDEESVLPMLVCSGKRLNTPKNFLLEICLKRLSGLGTCRMVCTLQKTGPGVWQVHQSPLSCLECVQALWPQPAKISSAGAHTVEGSGEQTCSFPGNSSAGNTRARAQFAQY